MPITPSCPAPNVYMQSIPGNCVRILLGGEGTQSNPYTLIPSLDLSSGNIICGPNGLEVCISSEPNNYLSVTDDGCLFVRGPVFADPNECQAGPCISISVTGSGCEGDEFVFHADPIIDPSLSNILECGLDGLLAEVSIVGIPTPTATTNVSGLGTSLSPFVLSTDVNISSDPDNAITITPTGLFVESCCDQITEIQCSDLAAISIDCLSDVDIAGIQDGDTLIFSAGGFIAGPAVSTETHIQVLDTFNVYQFDADLL